MIRHLTFLAFVFFSEYSCLAQTEYSEYKLSVNFSPSFSSPSTWTLNVTNAKATVEIIVYENDSTRKVLTKESSIVKPNDVSKISDFIKTYTFKVKSSIDTVSSERILRKGDSTTVYTISYGTDGITVDGELSHNETIRKFAFWSPKEGSENHLLTANIFTLSHKSFRKKKVKNYIKVLETYFKDK